MPAINGLVVEQLKPKRHDRDGFACGEPTLDAYLRQQAAQHHRDGISHKASTPHNTAIAVG